MRWEGGTKSKFVIIVLVFPLRKVRFRDIAQDHGAIETGVEKPYLLPATLGTRGLLFCSCWAGGWGRVWLAPRTAWNPKAKTHLRISLASTERSIHVTQTPFWQSWGGGIQRPQSIWEMYNPAALPGLPLVLYLERPNSSCPGNCISFL